MPTSIRILKVEGRKGEGTKADIRVRFAVMAGDEELRTRNVNVEVNLINPDSCKQGFAYIVEQIQKLQSSLSLSQYVKQLETKLKGAFGESSE